MDNIADIVTRHAGERARAPAISSPDGVIDYGTLERLVWQGAALLRRAGVAAGDVVGISLPESPEYLIATFALARIGAAHAPLPLVDPVPVRQAFAQRFGVRCIVAAAQSDGLPGLQVVRVARDTLAPMQAHVSPADRVDGGERVAQIWRTSGTTSEARGVTLTHAQWWAAEGSRVPYYPSPLEDRYLNVIEMSLSMGLNSCERAIYNGGTLFLPPKPLGVKAVLEIIDREAINRLALTPNMLDAVLPALPADRCRCPGIRDLTVAGMAMPESLRSEVRRRFTPGLNIKYGSNEARYVTSADAAMQVAHPETVGVAMPGVDLEIVDENDRPVAAGDMGQVRARAPWMAAGYYNAPGQDARTFRGGWVYLGDVGVLSKEGMLFLKGRVDDMMNFDGIKIFPAEIEAVLLQHPAVAEAAAFPVGSRRHQHLPAAAVTLKQDVTPEALRDFCRERLGRRAPGVVEIVKALPRNAMGKIVRRELAEQVVRRLQKKA